MTRNLAKKREASKHFQQDFQSSSPLPARPRFITFSRRSTFAAAPRRNFFFRPDMKSTSLVQTWTLDTDRALMNACPSNNRPHRGR
jgi:hypothetical protein